jgi:endonuclease/exonuclease/phosphatase family metal-dependent hydrolase
MNKAVKSFVSMLAVFIILATFYIFPCACCGEEGQNFISVLTYNIWGVISARHRNARIEKVPEAIMELDPDIICLIEAFRPKDHKVLRDGFDEMGYPIRTWHHHDCGYGTGILLISRFDSEEADYRNFKAQGEIYSYERLACRGLLSMVFNTPAGKLDFFATHSIPRMKLIFDDEGNLIEGDPKELYRYLQMYELARMIQEMRGHDTRSLVAAGDFNVSPEMREYRLLLRLSGLQNSFEVLHPGENPSTYCVQTNEFATIEGSRIDHILYQNYGGSKGFYLEPLESCVVMTGKRITRKGMMHLSDHYGMFTVFKIADKGEVSEADPPILSLPLKDMNFYIDGLDGNVIEFYPGKQGAWDALGLNILKDYDKKFSHPAMACKAAAKILVSKDESGMVRVELDDKEAAALEAYLDKMKQQP